MKTKYVKPEITTVEIDHVSILAGSGSSFFDDPTILPREDEID